jgi:hypothetical protein
MTQRLTAVFGALALAVAACGLGFITHSLGRSRALQEMVNFLDELAASGDAPDYQPDRVRVLASIGFTDPGFEDVRPWPLPDTDFYNRAPVIDS